MALPSVDPKRIEEALAQFDREERTLPKWQGWEGRDSYKYAVVKNGRLYPPKEIIALATGVPTSNFSGGAEANGFLRRHGFQIEALRLPTEGEVQSALHDLLRAPESVEPAEAYRFLADRFELPERLRSKSMENTDENHWQNRVRFARRKLVDAGILDPSEHGRWKLRLRPRPAVWIEKSLVKGRSDRVSGEHALGRALWSPLRAQNGDDIYRNMRLVQPGDIVLHFMDNSAFTGVSVAAGFARTDFTGIDGTDWAGAASYRIPLRDFTSLAPPLTREQLFEGDPETRKRLIEIRSVHSNLFYNPDLKLQQGGYLTEAPEPLIALLGDVYQAKAGRSLLGTHLGRPESPTSQAAEQRKEPPRVWLYAPGRKATYWDEFRAAGIAGIGWDYVGDLSIHPDAEAIKAQMEKQSSEPQSFVNANQCFDFSHRMAPGDWVFVKKGRREIIGFGVVVSAYRFVPDRPYYVHIRDVDWQKSGSWPTAFASAALHEDTYRHY